MLFRSAYGGDRETTIVAASRPARLKRTVARSGIVTVTGSGGMRRLPDPHYRLRFPAGIIVHAVWLYHVFSHSLRDVELLLTEGGIIVSYETVRRWCKKFGERCPTACVAGGFRSCDRI